MTHEMPGNPWVDFFQHNSRQASRALRLGEVKRSGILSQESMANATLALAYEQRTANLLAYMQLGVSAQVAGIDIADEVASELAERLGIELPDG